MTTDGDVLLRLVGEIDDLGARLARVGTELRTVRTGTTQAQPAQPQETAAQQTPPPYQPVPRVTLAEKLSKEGAGSRLLAWVGGAVTLLGIVLLLVLAIQRGWFGPMPRVIGGAVFGLALVGIGLRLHRTPAGRTGAFALAATGIGTLYLDTIAATTMYEYLPAFAGLAGGLLIAVGGLLLAVRWESSLLGMAVVLGCVVCAPLITEGFTPELVAFLLMVQIASTPVQLRQSWPSVAAAAGIPPLVASVFSTAFTGFGGSPETTAAALAAGGLGLALALVVTHKRPGDAAALVACRCLFLSCLVGMVVPDRLSLLCRAGLLLWVHRRSVRSC